MNPQECVWETLNHQITKTILQEKVKIHDSTTIWFTSFFCFATSYENSGSESSGGQGTGKLEKISAWNLTKVRRKK